MQVTWRVHPADPQRAEHLAAECGVHPLTAQLLLNRGITDRAQAQRFFHPELSALSDPATLPDLTHAVIRLRRAIRAREPMLIFGDSDVDGLTASVILFEVLRSLGAVVRARHSNRITDGYGLPSSIVQQLRCTSTRLVILVDCGTNQPEAIRALKARGIDTIIVDHHVPLEDWAEPDALINPYRDPHSQQRELSSAGLAFKLAQALIDEERCATYLDLAALGLLADYSPLVRDSRVIVAQGLARIVGSARPGLQRLCEATGTKTPQPESILRKLVPRLNASGRLGDSQAVWHLLRKDGSEQWDEWLEATGVAHETTKQLRREILPEAQEQVNRLHFKDQYVVIVGRKGWHQGLMGPLAAQLAERYGRPAIAVAMTERHGIGSGRSVPHFNLLEALKACQGVLVQFGGHAQACGLTVDVKQFEQFRALVNHHARLSLGREGLVKTRRVDLEVPLEAVHPRWVEEVERFAPFGSGNPRPTVVLRHVTIDVSSSRSTVLSDGTRRIAAKGRVPLPVADGRYDVLASPSMVDGEPVLTVSDAKVSTVPWGLART